MPQSKNTTTNAGNASAAKKTASSKTSSSKSNSSAKSSSTKKTGSKAPAKTASPAPEPKPERTPLSEDPVWNAAAPYVLAGLAILIAVCVILGQGRIGGGIRNLLTGLFGGAAYALPVFLLFRAFRRGRDLEEEQNTSRTVSTAFAFLLVSMLLHVFGGGEPELNAKIHFADGMELIGGGAFGGVFGELLMRGFGKVCTVILLLAGIVLLALYSAGVTPRSLFISLAYHIKFSGEKRQERRAAAEEKRKNAPPTRREAKDAEYLEYLRQKKQIEREAREAEAAARRAAAQDPVQPGAADQFAAEQPNADPQPANQPETDAPSPVGNPDVFEPEQLRPIAQETPAAPPFEKKVYRIKRRPVPVDIPVSGSADEIASGADGDPAKETNAAKEQAKAPAAENAGPERIEPEKPAASGKKPASPEKKPAVSVDEAADERLFDEVMRRTRERIEKNRRTEGLRDSEKQNKPAAAENVITVTAGNASDHNSDGSSEGTGGALPEEAFRKPLPEESVFAGFDAEVSDTAEIPTEEDDFDPDSADPAEIVAGDVLDAVEIAAYGVHEKGGRQPKPDKPKAASGTPVPGETDTAEESDEIPDPDDEDGFVTLTDDEPEDEAETDSVKLAVNGDASGSSAGTESAGEGGSDISGIFANPEDAELLDKLAEAYRNPLEVHRESVPAVLPTSEPQQKPVLAAKPEYRFPPIEILAEDPGVADDGIKEELQENAVKLVDTLRSFNVKTKIVNISRGPTITRYELQPEPGTKVRSITNLVDDISLNMATGGVRIEAPIPGKAAVGVEVPNKKQSTVHLRTLIEDSRFVDAKSRLTVCLGEDVAGEAVYFDIAKMPHLLIAGATGSGKSVCINSIITSILYKASPEDVKLILIDPKKVELNIYNGIPHLLVPVVSEPKKAAGSLSWAVGEMERRYGLIEEAGVRDIKAFNEVTKNDPDYEYMPRIVIIIDELADLMMTAPDDVEESICRIAQKARAAGMHLIIGTQRPSVDVITGLIKANVPSRIAFRTSSQIDSRTIIDIGSAANLIGMGDMLFNPVGALKPNRVQGAYVSESDVEEVVSYIKNMNAAYANGDSDKIVNEIEREAQKCGVGKKGSGSSSGSDESGDGDEGEDALLKQAVEIAVDSGKIATSLLQRRLSIGYGRAAKLIDRMEQLGYVSAPDGTKPRKVLISRQEFMEMRLKDEAPFDV